MIKHIKNNNIKIRAVLFDYDGVIADTMIDNYLAWKSTYYSYGINISKADYYPLEGRSTIEIASIISSKYNLKISNREISDKKNQYYEQNSSMKIYEGVEKIIDWLIKRNIRIALVTGSDKRRLRTSIPLLLKKFDIVVAGGDVKKGKPHPDPYLLAMERLSLRGDQCIIVENAPLGIESAIATNSYCIAISTTANEIELKKADEIVPSHSILFNKIKSLI